MSEVPNVFSKKVADRYLKREVLGEGTYGVVSKAIDTKVRISFSYWLNIGFRSRFEFPLVAEEMEEKRKRTSSSPLSWLY